MGEDRRAAIVLYGSTWNKMVDDVSDGFFKNYVVEPTLNRPPTTTAAQLPITSIDHDKNLRAPTYIDTLRMPASAR